MLEYFFKDLRVLVVLLALLKIIHYCIMFRKLFRQSFSRKHTHSCYTVAASAEPPVVSKEYALKVLGLRSFCEEEIRQSFDSIKNSHLNSNQNNHADDIIDLEGGIRALLESHIPSESRNSVDIHKIAQKIAFILTLTDDATNRKAEKINEISFPEYHKLVLQLGEKLDARIYNIAASFLMAGSSIGIIIPCMPILVSQLAMPSSEFGFVTSAFGISKLLGNIPSGYLVEQYGRKPVIIAGMGLCAVGMGSIGLTLLPGFGTPWWIGCRLLSGLGVSMFVAGGTMYMTDISTALNRTRTTAPVMASFSGGTAVGPVVGTVLLQYIGLSRTYLTVGGLFMALAALNSKLPETSPAMNQPYPHLLVEKKMSHTQQLYRVIQGTKDSFGVSWTAWKKLWKGPALRNVVLLQGSFWFVLSGSQMTLLPLLLLSPTLQLSSVEIGSSFAFMSLVAFAASQPSAFLADRYGKVPNMLAGCSILAVSVAALPYVLSYSSLLTALFPMAIGSTVMHSTPTALTSDLSSTRQRSQALSLLRTCGDAGMVAGALCAGFVASVSSIEHAFLLNSTVLACSTAVFAYAQRLHPSSPSVLHPLQQPHHQKKLQHPELMSKSTTHKDLQDLPVQKKDDRS